MIIHWDFKWKIWRPFDYKNWLLSDQLTIQTFQFIDVDNGGIPETHKEVSQTKR